MKKFREFKVNATRNNVVIGEVDKQSQYLNYDGIYKGSQLFFFYRNGEVCHSNNKDYFISHKLEEITLDEFFALTPEDVIVEPERFNCRFQFENVNYGDDISGDYTKDQIDRVKSILSEAKP